LGNGLLIDLGIARPDLPVAVCPGPNIAYFDREYTLCEMVDHIYGRGPSLVPATRPNMFAKELQMYVDHFEKLVDETPPGDGRAMAKLAAFKENLEKGLAHYRDLVTGEPFAGENLTSLAQAIHTQTGRIEEAWRRGWLRSSLPERGGQGASSVHP
jgi:hypothetical protein